MTIKSRETVKELLHQAMQLAPEQRARLNVERKCLAGANRHAAVW